MHRQDVHVPHVPATDFGCEELARALHAHRTELDDMSAAPVPTAASMKKSSAKMLLHTLPNLEIYSGLKVALLVTIIPQCLSEI